jgi:putative alpha-1,2-mannosidase
VQVPGQTGRGPLVIDAPKAGNRPFVTALTVNGRAQNSPWISYQTLRDGAHLTSTLSATQDPSWGSGS